MSLHLYKDDTTDFINFWNHMYSPTKLFSIVATRNFPSLYASDVTFFLSFLKTNNVYGYIMTPSDMESLCDNHFSTRPLPTVLRHTLQHILHFIHTSPTYAQTSFWKILLSYDVPTSVQSYIHITPFSRIY